MIKFDAEDFERQINSIIESVTQRIEKGVEKFVVYTATQVIRSTPYGDVDKYTWLYEQRQEKYGFEMLPGLAKGSWVVSMNSAPNLGAISYDNKLGVESGRRAIINAQEYQIGDDIYISNSVPYIMNLEEGSSKQMQPGGFTEAFESVYAVNLSKFFKEKNTGLGKFE